MSAKVVQKGFSTVGFNQKGELVQQDVAIVHAVVPGPNGEWCFVVQKGKFCWVNGLEKGFRLYEYPLSGPQDTWQQQIMDYLRAGPPVSGEYTQVLVGTEIALAQDGYFIIAE